MTFARLLGSVSLVSVLFVGLGCEGEQGQPVSGGEAAVEAGEVSSEAKIDCSMVKCAMPLCGPRQHLSKQGCCPVCVGPEDRCAAVMCAAVACGEGEQLVFKGNDCCGRCEPVPAAAECTTDLDCPQYACFACPCPVAECVGRKCVTTTPDASTCGGL